MLAWAINNLGFAGNRHNHTSVRSSGEMLAWAGNTHSVNCAGENRHLQFQFQTTFVNSAQHSRNWLYETLTTKRETSNRDFSDIHTPQECQHSVCTWNFSPAILSLNTYQYVATREIRQGPQPSPFAVRTLLGWIVTWHLSVRTSYSSSQTNFNTHRIHKNDVLIQMVKRIRLADCTCKNTTADL